MTICNCSKEGKYLTDSLGSQLGSVEEPSHDKIDRCVRRATVSDRPSVGLGVPINSNSSKNK